MALFVLLLLIGHGFLWVAAINRVHAVSMPRRITKTITAAFFFLGGTIPLAVLWNFGDWPADWAAAREAIRARPILDFYFNLALTAGIFSIVQWTWRQFFDAARSHERYCRVVSREKIPSTDAQSNKSGEHTRLVSLPGNEALWLEEIDRGLEIPRLPAALEDLSILQISDIHFTGRVGKSYFVEVARRCNQRNADLIVITGDLIDEEECFPWIADTWGALRAPHGVYCIFGNHERRINAAAFRKVITDAGLVYLGGRCMAIEVRGQRIVLAGNEAPWFRPAADFREVGPPSSRGGPLRIALTHSPDQLAWARRNEVDLMLSGHTHGGQCRIPGIGPVFSPTFRGVRYAYGTFYVRPTVMHVSKGISADMPLRYWCMPEAVKLSLHAPGRLESD